jgi:hypothetical protein
VCVFVCACCCYCCCFCCCRGDGGGASGTLRPSPDTPYHWSAFNKLLLLGMYAPVEEATLVGNEQDSWVAVQQLQDLADAREVCGHSGCSPGYAKGSAASRGSGV